jgi:hypothetical protein
MDEPGVVVERAIVVVDSSAGEDDRRRHEGTACGSTDHVDLARPSAQPRASDHDRCGVARCCRGSPRSVGELKRAWGGSGRGIRVDGPRGNTIRRVPSVLRAVVPPLGRRLGPRLDLHGGIGRGATGRNWRVVAWLRHARDCPTSAAVRIITAWARDALARPRTCSAHATDPRRGGADAGPRDEDRRTC